MYETYPNSKNLSNKSGWGDGYGSSYPGGAAGCQDDTGKVKCDMQSGASGAPAACCYPKRGADRFSNLSGLKS